MYKFLIEIKREHQYQENKKLFNPANGMGQILPP